MTVSACGSGSSISNAITTITTAATKAADPTQAQKETDAGRLAKQATFGATPDLISHIVSIGTSAWLDEQFAATGSTYADIAVPTPKATCATMTDKTFCNFRYWSRQPVAMRFYTDALSQSDQLRQRVAFALSQLIVVSSAQVNDAAGVATINQLFLNNAFGNYRDILMTATLNGFMGDYLNMANNWASSPNENYAREFLQLFTMGPNKLNMDGTPITDSTGANTPNYTSDDIKGAAKALTGWSITHLPDGANDYTVAMTQTPTTYDKTAKTFLGVTVPAGASQTDSVKAVVDAAFNNASTPPYIAKYLIGQLVTPNPTPAYVARVAAVFANNGSNVRGDLKAVVRAILTDSEARTAPTGDAGGKVKEPVLLMTSIARAAGMVSDGWVFTIRDTTLGERIFESPSVFNFYPPDFPLPQSTTLLSPASKLMTAGGTVLRHNLVYDWTIAYATAAKGEFAVTNGPGVTNGTGTSIDWSKWEALGTDVAGMIDRIDLILLNRTITTAQKTALTNAANAITNADPATQARMRAQALLYIVGTSPLFQVDR